MWHMQLERLSLCLSVSLYHSLSGVGLTRNPGAQMQLERDANAQVDQQRAAQQAGQDQQRVARVEQVIPVPDALFLCRSGHPRAIFKGLTVLW